MAIVQFSSGTASNVTKAQADYGFLYNNLRTSLPTAVRDSDQLGGDLQQLIGGTDGQGGVSLLGGLQSLRKILTFGSELKTIAATTPTRIRQLQNQEAVVKLIRQSAIVEMARYTADVDFESVDEAIAIRDEISELLDIEANESEDDGVFRALKDLRAAVSRDVSVRSADLSRIEQRPPVARSNSLVMAYNLYGDATREREIVDRNQLFMPGFIFPNQSVQVLNA